MIGTKQIFSQPRVTQAVLGVSHEEFTRLVPVFGKCLVDYRIQLTPKRKRRVGGGRKGDLPETEDKLLLHTALPQAVPYLRRHGRLN